jgi:hypothetical protein
MLRPAVHWRLHEFVPADCLLSVASTFLVSSAMATAGYYITGNELIVRTVRPKYSLASLLLLSTDCSVYLLS